MNELAAVLMSHRLPMLVVWLVSQGVYSCSPEECSSTHFLLSTFLPTGTFCYYPWSNPPCTQGAWGGTRVPTGPRRAILHHTSSQCIGAGVRALDCQVFQYDEEHQPVLYQPLLRMFFQV